MYSHFRVPSPVQTLHNAITHVIIYSAGIAESHVLIAIVIHVRLHTSDTLIT